MKESKLIFRNRNFFLVWTGQVLSQGGTRMYQIAILWWILSILKGTGGMEVGAFMVLSAIPAILFMKYIGKTIDGMKSKIVLASSDGIAFITVALVAAGLLSNQMDLHLMYAAGFTIALCQAFIDPTLNKAVPELVDARDIETAVAFQSSTQSLANFGGAVAGAVLIEYLGIPGIAILNAGTYLVSMICNLLASFNYTDRPGDENVQDTGWKVLKGQGHILRILAGFSLINFFATPILVVLPLYTKHVLSAGPSTLGSLEAAIWIGLICGTFSAGRITFTSNTIRLGGACLFVLGFSLFIPGLIIHHLFFMAMLFIAGCALGVNNVKFISLFHEIVPPHKKGRFFAIMQALVTFTFPVAYFVFGVLADSMSPRYVCLIQGSGVMLLSVYFFSLSGSFSKLAWEEQG